MLQEALSNVARHSGASEAIGAAALSSAGMLELEVEDHGSGLDAGTGAPRGLGLVAMRERAELVGGTLDVPAAARRRHAGAAERAA